jgi:hypothetical protein
MKEERSLLGVYVILIVIAVLLLCLILISLVSSQVSNYQDYRAEAIAECVAYNFNHTNSSCWV